MRTLAVLIALSLATLLSSGAEAWARQRGQVVIGNGFAFSNRSFAVVPRSRTVIVERPFFERRFFANRPIIVERPFFERRFVINRPVIVERPVIIERRVFVPRREFFFFDGFGPFN
jgi:hypothetical protein